MPAIYRVTVGTATMAKTTDYQEASDIAHYYLETSGEPVIMWRGHELMWSYECPSNGARS